MTIYPMKIRTLLRNEALQIKLEKKGAVVSPFLIPENIQWLLKVVKEKPDEAENTVDAARIHETLNEKLQSKVEYRCINCSPFQIYFNKTANHPSVFLKPSITDENRFCSLNLIAPLSTAEDSLLEFKYLAGAHLLTIPPRGINIAGYYEKNEEYLLQNFSSLKVKPGEAVLFFSNVPYIIKSPEVILLEISILPYEARQILYEGVEEENEKFLQPYEMEISSFIEYQQNRFSALSKMKPLRKTPIIPGVMSDKERQELLVKVSLYKLFLKTMGLSKFFRA